MSECYDEIVPWRLTHCWVGATHVHYGEHWHPSPYGRFEID